MHPLSDHGNKSVDGMIPQDEAHSLSFLPDQEQALVQCVFDAVKGDCLGSLMAYAGDKRQCSLSYPLPL